MRPRGVRRLVRRQAVALVFLTLGAAIVARAHEIPADILVQIFVKQDPGELRMLVRLPLTGMRDVIFPTRDPGYLVIDEAMPLVRSSAALWVAGGVTVLVDGEPLEPPALGRVRLSLPADRSFATWDGALAHMAGEPLAADTPLLLDQALLDVELTLPLGATDGRLSLDSDLAQLGLRATTSLRVVLPDGAERAFAWVGDPGVVPLDPRWHEAAWRFVSLGFEHILGGIDHLLFLLCLVAPFRRLRDLVLIVTAFTVAHSVTLIAAALGYAPQALWFPPLVETLIAASIVYMAIENIVMQAPGASAAGAPWLARHSVRRRWMLTCAFGLIHGFGFSFALGETLQFAGAHLVTSLVAFNVGVELGQLLAVIVLVPVLGWLFRRVVPEAAGIIIVSALVAHTAWHWMMERGSTLSSYAWTTPDAMDIAGALRWTMRIVAVIGVIWLAGTFLRRNPGTTGTTDTTGTT